MRWLLWKCGLVQLVVTVDNDGECRVRVVRKSLDGLWVWGICGGRSGTKGWLRPDGTIVAGLCMRRWLPYTGLGCLRSLTHRHDTNRACRADACDMHQLTLGGAQPRRGCRDRLALDLDELN